MRTKVSNMIMIVFIAVLMVYDFDMIDKSTKPYTICNCNELDIKSTTRYHYRKCIESECTK